MDTVSPVARKNKMIWHYLKKTENKWTNTILNAVLNLHQVMTFLAMLDNHFFIF